MLRIDSEYISLYQRMQGVGLECSALHMEYIRVRKWKAYVNVLRSGCPWNLVISWLTKDCGGMVLDQIRILDCAVLVLED